MQTTYYVEDKRGNGAFMHTSATTAYGMAHAALAALAVSEGSYCYYSPDELIEGIMSAYYTTRRRAVLRYAMALEGIEVYPCEYIRSAGAYKRSYRPLSIDWFINEFYC